eukprot:CCRYP_011888-RA/>CCRYP_011888-RA protein AED:0.22 eAED:0.22 QI:0/0/0/1/0/0/2/0/82
MACTKQTACKSTVVIELAESSLRPKQPTKLPMLQEVSRSPTFFIVQELLQSVRFFFKGDLHYASIALEASQEASDVYLFWTL